MRAWYDIAGADFNNPRDIAGVQQSPTAIEELIAANEAGNPGGADRARRFSQGGAIALYAGLRYRERTGRILALSTYLWPRTSFRSRPPAVNRDVPIFHGARPADPMIRLEWAEASRKAMKPAALSRVWHTFAWSTRCARGNQAISAWLQKVLADEGTLVSSRASSARASRGRRR